MAAAAACSSKRDAAMFVFLCCSIVAVCCIWLCLRLTVYIIVLLLISTVLGCLSGFVFLPRLKMYSDSIPAFTIVILVRCYLVSALFIVICKARVFCCYPRSLLSCFGLVRCYLQSLCVLFITCCHQYFSSCHWNEMVLLNFVIWMWLTSLTCFSWTSLPYSTK